MTTEDRIAKQIERAAEAMDSLTAASSTEDQLTAAKALESAACQLRRALKKTQTGGQS